MSFAPVSGFPVEHNGASTTLTINSGESVIIVAMDGGAANSTLAVSDGGTNTYVGLGTKSDTRSGITTTLVACMKPTPGTYTLTLTGQTGNGAMNISKYTGVSSFSAGSFESFFAGGTVPTTTDACATPAITPSAFPAMIFAAAQTLPNAVLVPGTGFTSRFANAGAGDGGNGVYIEDLRLTSGSNIASFTLTSSGANTDVTVIGAAFIESNASANGAPFAPIALDSATRPGGSDQINLGSGPNTGTGDPLDTAFTKLKQWAADLNTMTGQLYPSRSLQTPVTGFSIAAAAGVTKLILNPAGTLATGTVTLPANPGDAQPFVLATTQAITALTVNTSDGSTLNGAPTTLAANTSVRWVFELALNTWIREQ